MNRTVTLASQDDITALAGCVEVRGLVIRTGAPLDVRPLGSLTRISGDLRVGPTLAVEELALTGLRTVTGAIRIESNALLRGTFLPALESAGSVSVAGNAALTTVSLPKLAAVAGTVTLIEHGSLEIVDLQALATIGEDLVIADNPVLAVVDVGRLARVRAVRAHGNRALGELQVPVPSRPAGDTGIENR